MSFKMAVHASLHVLANIKYISFVIFKYDASKKKNFIFATVYLQECYDTFQYWCT